jgi:ubiquinone/menaquinone biosynthesis C-methylase UbiE
MLRLCRLAIFDCQLDIRRPRLRERFIAAGHDRLSAGAEREIYGAQRRELLAAARGRVLDVGAGTGANLPHFPRAQALDLVLLDPSAGMLERAYRRALELGVSVQLVDKPAEKLPFDAESFDTVVFAMTLCTIGDPASALREARRVLRPPGRLLVFEHVRASEPDLARWQDRFDPLWRTINNGCHPNRNTRAAIAAAGFEFERIDEFREQRIPLSIVQPHLIGVARKRAIG